jgi:MFS family permease
MLLVGAAMVGLFFALSVYMQVVLGYNALTTGLTQLPLAGALVIVAGVTPAVIGRLGAKRTLVGSLLVLAGGLVWLSFAPADAVFVSQLLGPTVLIGIGMGAAFVTTTQLAVDGVDGGEAGLAGGLINTSQQIGGAIGLAVLATIASLRTDALVDAGAPALEAVTGGFSWLFIGAAIISVVAAGVAAFSRDGHR